jgi:hypothetical protein
MKTKHIKIPTPAAMPAVAAVLMTCRCVGWCGDNIFAVGVVGEFEVNVEDAVEVAEADFELGEDVDFVVTGLEDDDEEEVE